MTAFSFATPLEDLTVIAIEGADSTDFLHGQLTHDVAALPADQARLAGYCTAKGRLLASLIFWRDATQADRYLALVRNDLADAVVKRLSMFVLRAKVKVQRSDLHVWGVAALPNQAPADGLAVTPNAWAYQAQGSAHWIASGQAAPDSYLRWYCIAPADAGPATDAEQTDHAQQWQVDDIRIGLPWIQALSQEVFIPQTVNLDLIDGVSFTKGCYPGQEVVARSHYRGTIKRRMAAGHYQAGDQPPAQVGTDIFDAQRPDSPWGRIVNTATWQGQTYILFEAQLADLDSAALHVGSAAGPLIQTLPLPYSLTPAE